jgi:integrase/recombinase XerD
MNVSKEITLVKADPTTKKWLGTTVKRLTRNTYAASLAKFVEFTKMTPSQLIDEAIEDMKKDPRERRDVVVSRLISFYNYLKNDYILRDGKRGMNDKSIITHITGVRSFYASFEVAVRLKGRKAFPKPRVANKRLIVNAEQVKTLLDYAPGVRDRAIILTMFQSGMDVSTLCSLKYGDVARGLEGGELPMRVDLQRPKTGVEYYTFLGKTAVEAIKAYIRDMKERGVVFEKDTSLFLKERDTNGGDRGLETDLVQVMMKKTAYKAGFVDSKGYNILGPHALRESFGSIMINSGVPDTVVDFWLGHTIGEMNQAYKTLQFESLKKMYIERERLLDPYASMSNGELQKKIDAMVNDRTADLSKSCQELQAISNVLLKKNIELEDQQKRQQEEIAKIKEELRGVLADLKKLAG